jgi:hypothetical protein
MKAVVRADGRPVGWVPSGGGGDDRAHRQEGATRAPAREWSVRMASGRRTLHKSGPETRHRRRTSDRFVVVFDPLWSSFPCCCPSSVPSRPKPGPPSACTQISQFVISSSAARRRQTDQWSERRRQMKNVPAMRARQHGDRAANERHTTTAGPLYVRCYLGTAKV